MIRIDNKKKYVAPSTCINLDITYYILQNSNVEDTMKNLEKGRGNSYIFVIKDHQYWAKS